MPSALGIMSPLNSLLITTLSLVASPIVMFPPIVRSPAIATVPFLAIVIRSVPKVSNLIISSSELSSN